MKIESKIGKAAYDDKQIYDFVTDFNNFGDLLPSGKVSQWQASADECSFRVEPLGSVGLTMVEKVPCTLVKINSMPSYSNHQFTIWIQLKQVAEKDTRVKITIEPQVNRMLLPMIKGPLKAFVDGLVDKIEGFDFGS